MSSKLNTSSGSLGTCFGLGFSSNMRFTTTSTLGNTVSKQSLKNLSDDFNFIASNAFCLPSLFLIQMLIASLLKNQ